MSWLGRSVWVIGASTGIGAALAGELANAGCKVTISARNAQQLETVAREGMRVRPADMTDHAVLRAIADELAAVGELDIVVISAGYWKQDQGLEFDLQEFQRHLDVNLTGVGNVIDAVLQHLKSRNSGRVAVLSSVAGYRGMPGSLAYGATKAAQINLFEALRATFRGTGIFFQTISPGFVETPMTSTNTFPMPFIINSEKAAKSIVKGLATNKPELVFPWQMALVMRIAKFVPQRLWIRLVGGRG